MIPIYLDVSNEVKRKINENVNCMFDFLMAICDGLSYEEILQDIFPSYILEVNHNKCVNAVKELYNITRDKFEREHLSPFLEWTLYHTITWWIDVADDIELDEIPRQECVSKDGRDLYDILNKAEKYLDFLFADWDFLYVEKLYAIYKRDSGIVEKVFHIDMERYIDLMPIDIQEEYKKNKCVVQSVKKEVDEQERLIVNSIWNFLQLEMLRAKKYEECNEVDLSDNIRNGLFLLFKREGLDIERESRAGYAVADLGELDFYIYCYEEGIYRQVAIGENKQWGAYKDSLGQLLGYMNHNTKFGFTIIYNKDTRLNTVLEGRKKILQEYNVDGKFKLVGEIEEMKDMTDVLRTCHENPEKTGAYFYLYHFVFNVCNPERAKAANVGRKRTRKRK
ncbi:MAG: hypothetical protein IJC02_10455 [Lachnospiraceae bacterium]|nr:hypothetical protein [Lachnospiraceae bacterium]